MSNLLFSSAASSSPQASLSSHSDQSTSALQRGPLIAQCTTQPANSTNDFTANISVSNHSQPSVQSQLSRLQQEAGVHSPAISPSVTLSQSGGFLKSDEASAEDSLQHNGQISPAHALASVAVADDDLKANTSLTASPMTSLHVESLAHEEGRRVLTGNLEEDNYQEDTMPGGESSPVIAPVRLDATWKSRSQPMTSEVTSSEHCSPHEAMQQGKTEVESLKLPVAQEHDESEAKQDDLTEKAEKLIVGKVLSGRTKIEEGDVAAASKLTASQQVSIMPPSLGQSNLQAAWAVQRREQEERRRQREEEARLAWQREQEALAEMQRDEEVGSVDLGGSAL